MGLTILRCVFVVVVMGWGAFFAQSGTAITDSSWVLKSVGLGMFALAIIALDVLARKKSVSMVSSIYFGLIVGLFLAYVAGLALSPIFMPSPTRGMVQILLSVVLCYGCISLLMQTKDDFRFIIPYVEFTKEVKLRHPYILDTSVIIDGRLADVVDTGLIDNQLVIPQFVLAELQAIADSSERQRRARGRNGLDVLNRLRGNTQVELTIFDHELPEWADQPVDMKLVALTKHLHGKLVTNDFNLNKIAKVHGVTVISLFDLANAMKPKFLPGDRAEVHIVRPGEASGQGIGYLDDGTMVVVEKGRDYIDQNVPILITSMLQTSAGRMVFGRVENT